MTGTPRVSRYSIVAATSRIAFGPAQTTATGVRASSSRSAEISSVGDPPPSGDWTELYETYFKAGTPVTTIGHCGNCHVGTGIKSFGTGDNSSSQTCAGLKKSVLFGHTADGGVDLSTTTIADPAKTLLVWFGGPLGRMPQPELGLPKPTCNARAAAAVTAWVAAGAICPP